MRVVGFWGYFKDRTDRDCWGTECVFRREKGEGDHSKGFPQATGKMELLSEMGKVEEWR